MENELQTNLDEILLDKETNLLPENLKEGVTVLGVEGSLKVTGSDSNIKLFETVQDMNNDPNPKEDDLAVVYRKEIQPFKEDTETQFITFPEQVILDESFTGNINGMLRSVDPSVMFDGQVRLNANMFHFDGWSETGMIQVRYQSEDGITYTRQEFMGDSGDLTNPVDLGTIVKWEPMEPFNDVIGKFMLVGGNYFEGLYEFNSQLEKDLIKLIPLENVTFDLDASNGFSNFQIDYNSNYIFSLTKVVNILNKINDEYNNDTRGYILCIDSDGDLCALEGRVSDSDMFIHQARDWGNPIYDFDKNFLGIAWYNTGSYNTLTTPYIRKYSLNLNDSTFSIKGNTLPKLTGGDSSTSPHTKYWPVDIVTVPMYITISTTSPNDFTISYYASSGSTYDRVSHSFNYTNEVYQEKYRIAPAQLNSVASCVYESIFYGKNGVELGTLTQNVSNQFTDMNAEVYSKIQQQYDKLEPKVLTDSDKTIDKNISVIPIKSNGTPLLDTSNVTNMAHIFMDCTNLQTISQLDTSNVTNMTHIFVGCTNLQTISQLNTSNVTDMSNMFSNCQNLATVPELDTSKVTNMNDMFLRCTSLTNIPNLNTSNATRMSTTFGSCSNLISISNIDTSNVTDMASTFVNCQNLATVPLLDTTRVNNMYRTFGNCRSLTNDSLNNILYMCSTSNITNTSRKTLEFIGLTQDQANICMNLSNYQNFINAGWTTGY